MIIGESMKAVTDLSKVHESISGDLYEDHNQMLMGRALDFGRTLFVMLQRKFGDTEVDVYWDYYTNILTAIVVIDGRKFGKSIRDIYDARDEKLRQIRDFVTELKEEVDKCASQSQSLAQAPAASSPHKRSS